MIKRLEAIGVDMRQEQKNEIVLALALRLNEERRRRWVRQQEERKLPAPRKIAHPLPNLKP